METWKPVVGFEGLYEVSDLGRVRSLDRLTNAKCGSLATRKGRVLVPQVAPNGYLKVSLTAGSVRVQRNIHVLVCQSFIGVREVSAHVRHLNGDQKDNRLSNLMYGSAKENAEDKIRHGTVLLGEKAPRATISDFTAVLISEALRSKPNAVVAREFNVSPTVVYGIKTKKTFRHLWTANA